ncbi:hypothetical protein GCM10027091_67580 [Streptomyces daliensis]
MALARFMGELVTRTRRAPERAPVAELAVSIIPTCADLIACSSAACTKRALSTLARTREVVAGHRSKAPEVTDWIEVSRRWS